MRFSRLLQVIAAVLFLPALAAYADTVTTFNFAGTFDLGTVPDTASGTVTIDTTSGAVQTIDLTFPTLSSEAGVPSTMSESYGPPQNFTQIGETWIGQPGMNYYAGIGLDIPVASLVGYAGGNICSLDDPCADATSGIVIGIDGYDFIDGTLSPTPEPSSLTLLGAGALAMVGMMRDRLFRSWKLRI